MELQAASRTGRTHAQTSGHGGTFRDLLGRETEVDEERRVGEWSAPLLHNGNSSDEKERKTTDQRDVGSAAKSGRTAAPHWSVSVSRLFQLHGLFLRFRCNYDQKPSSVDS